MIFHENHLLADDSHEISNLIFLEIMKDVEKFVVSAVVISALRVNGTQRASIYRAGVWWL